MFSVLTKMRRNCHEPSLKVQRKYLLISAFFFQFNLLNEIKAYTIFLTKFKKIPQVYKGEKAMVQR